VKPWNRAQCGQFRGKELEYRLDIFRATTGAHIEAPHNRYQPHPAEPVQYAKSSNWAFVLLKMGIMVPETC
jgi:hypothetical protein